MTDHREHDFKIGQRVDELGVRQGTVVGLFHERGVEVKFDSGLQVVCLHSDLVATNQEGERTSYFTFGQNHAHRNGGVTFDCDTLVKITAPNPREVMVDQFGVKWGMEYDTPPEPMFWPRGCFDLTIREWINPAPPTPDQEGQDG